MDLVTKNQKERSPKLPIGNKIEVEKKAHKKDAKLSNFFYRLFKKNSTGDIFFCRGGVIIP